MRFTKIFLLSLLLITLIDLFPSLNSGINASKKDVLVSSIINDNLWHRLDFKISFIEAEFLQNQESVILETEKTSLPISLTRSNFEWIDWDELNWEVNKFSTVSSIPPSQWIKLTSKWPIKIYWWNEEIWKNITDPIRNIWAGINSKITWLSIISRRDWWADETLRYNYSTWVVWKRSSNNVKTTINWKSDNKCAQIISKYPNEFIYDKIEYSDNNWMPLLWPYQYSPNIRKAVVHHTAESDSSNDLPWEKKMRSIYRYHTITRWWWDIWYNYVIDQKWNIYEWRSWWNYVVWAHSYCNNIWTMWVSLMWNFQNSFPTTKQLTSLAKLISYLGQKYWFSPSFSSSFHWVTTFNILWHRDLQATACPWDNLYKKLPNIAKQIELSNFNFDIDNTTTNNSSKETSVENKSDLKVLEIEPTSTKIITFSYKNTWTDTWNKWTWLYAVDNNNKNLFVTSIFADKNYVAANMREDSVKPGFIWHFDVEINSWYEPWIYSIELVPIINWIKKLTKWTIIQPIEVKSATNSYTFTQLIAPQSENYYWQSISAKIKLYNSWNTTWYRSWDYAITMKTYPLWRESLFIPWGSDNDPTILARLVEPKITPWEIWTFEFLLRAPLKYWTFEEKFIPVIWKNSIIWDRSMQFNFNIKKPNYQAQLLRESTKNTFYAWEKKTIRLWLKNISNVPWEPEQVEFRIAKSWDLKFDLTSYPITDFVPVHKAWFINVTIQAPNKPWKFTAIVQALANWKQFERLWRFNLEIEVEDPVLKWDITYQSANKLYIPLGWNDKFTIRIRNRTNIIWNKNGKNKIALITKTLNSPIKSPKWKSDSVVALMEEDHVNPWNTATFEIYLKAKKEWNFIENFFVHMGWMWEITWAKTNIEVISWKKNIKNGNNWANNNKLLDIWTTKKLKMQSSDSEKQASLIQAIEFLKNRWKKSKELKSIEKVNAISTDTENIKVKLSFPWNVVNIKWIWKIMIYLDNKQLNTLSESSIWVKNIWSYNLLVNIDWNKYEWRKFRAIASDNNSFVKIENWDKTTKWSPNFNDNFFRWSIDIIPIDWNFVWRVDVVNTLDFEDYMKWVAEVPESSSNEKRKALSIVARSYAVHYTVSKYRKFPWKYYDASDSPNVFQKYLWAWYELRSPKWQKALIDTRWEVVMYNWEVLRTAYFSCSNWMTKTPNQAWWRGSEYFKRVINVYQSVNDELWRDMDRYNKWTCGHWVWLSGLWAENLSKQWMSYKKILYYYYQDIDIIKL